MALPFCVARAIGYKAQLPEQGPGGWLMGWLYYQSGSILPGWVSHSLVNAFGVWLAAML